MPLFMDLHKASDYDVTPTIEEIKQNHIADIKTQEKFGVKFIQYWVNEEAGLVFCLMEAPSKEACVATHQEAHGNIPCNVVELKGGDYKAFMGSANPNAFDIAENNDGTLDSGRRVIMVVDIIATSPIRTPDKIFRDAIDRFNGREADHGNGRLMGIFNLPIHAVSSAQTIQREFRRTNNGKNEIRIGISSGEPITENKGFFSRAIQQADLLCDVSQNNQILVSPQIGDSFGNQSTNERDRFLFRALSPSDEKLVNDFMGALNSATDTSVEALCKSIGLSKAQLYRKITSLTGYSPNNFIREIRLKKSFKLVSQRFGNITEIAVASGFNSPSYFTRSFQKRFGLAPGSLLKA